MKILIAVVPMLIFCSLECVSARNLQISEFNADKWLDIPLIKIDRQCDQKDKQEIFHELLSEYRLNIIKFVKSFEEQGIGESDFTWHYIYNTDMINILKKLIQVIQECLDEEMRLDSEGIVTLMDRILKAYSMKIAKMEQINQTDFDCMALSGREKPPCKEEFPSGYSKYSHRKIYDELMLQAIENSNCEANLPYLQCIMKELQICSPKVRKVVKVVLSPAEVPICNNYAQEEDPEIEDIGEGISDLLERNAEKSFSFKQFLPL